MWWRNYLYPPLYWMAKLKLDIEPDLDVHIIAISSHVNDYRLCWSLNQALSIAMERRRRDMEGQGPEQRAYFSAFDHTEEPSQANITLVSNHAPEGVLLLDQRQADFFLLIDGESMMRPETVVDQLRRAEFVLAAFTLDPKHLKGAYKLLQ